MTKWCSKLPVLALNLSPVCTGGWSRFHNDLPQTFPKICACLIAVSDLWQYIFFSKPVILYRTSFEGNYLGEPIIVDWNTVYRKREPLLNKQVQQLLTFKILQTPTSLLFKTKWESAPHILFNIFNVSSWITN